MSDCIAWSEQSEQVDITDGHIMSCSADVCTILKKATHRLLVDTSLRPQQHSGTNSHAKETVMPHKIRKEYL